MDTLFFYFGKLILTSGVLFLYYKLFLKDKTFHHYNRFYLLAAVMISLFLPLLKVSYFTLEVNSNLFLLINKVQHFNSNNSLNNDFIYLKISTLLVGLVAVFFIMKLLFGLVKIQILKKKFSKENFDGINFYQTNLEEAPFSFFKNLFWKDSISIESDLGRQILKHEIVHIEQKHSWDKIFAETISSLFWFNPFFYFIKKDLYLIHEYLADKKSIKNSDTKAFAQMLLASHFSGKQLPATSPFLSSNLKKRLTMLKKSKPKFSYARRLFALPLLFILSFLYLINAKNKEIKTNNADIENAVSKLKLDTIKPNETRNNITGKDIAFGTDGTKIYQEHPELFIDSDTIMADDLPNSLGFLKRIKDAEKRAAEAEKLVNSPEFIKRIQDAEKRATAAEKLVNSPRFRRKIEEAEKRAAEAEKLVNSPEFIKRIKDADRRAAEAEKLVNSPEFIKKIEDAQRRATDAEKLVNSAEFKKKMKESELKVTEAEKKFNSPTFQRRMKETELKIKESEKKYKDAAFQQSLNDSEIIAVESVNFKPNTVLKQMEDINIFIDNKPSTREEMQKLDHGKIESVRVFKKGFENKKNGEIHINLKK